MNYSIKPEEHELREARKVVQGALEASKAVLQKEENLKVELGWSGEGYVREKMGGVSGFTHSKNRIELKFSNVEGWKEMLKASTAHEYAHSSFFESKHRDELTFNWQDVVFEAHAQIFAEKVFPEIETPWRRKYTKEEIRDRWDVIRQKMSEEIDSERSFMYGTDELPEWIGYSVSYLIGQKLLDNHELKEFPELKRSDVLEAGDALFY